MTETDENLRAAFLRDQSSSCIGMNSGRSGFSWEVDQVSDMVSLLPRLWMRSFLSEFYFKPGSTEARLTCPHSITWSREASQLRHRPRVVSPAAVKHCSGEKKLNLDRIYVDQTSRAQIHGRVSFQSFSGFTSQHHLNSITCGLSLNTSLCHCLSYAEKIRT